MSFRMREPVQHVKRTLYDAHFEGYTKTGRVSVMHNIAHPHGVVWQIASFKPENIVSANLSGSESHG